MTSTRSTSDVPNWKHNTCSFLVKIEVCSGMTEVAKAMEGKLVHLTFSCASHQNKQNEEKEIGIIHSVLTIHMKAIQILSVGNHAKGADEFGLECFGMSEWVRLNSM